MGVFERFLSVWVGLVIAAGVLLGVLFPAVFQAVAGFEFASINLLIAVLIWVMIYPMMIQIDFESVKQVRAEPRGLYLTLAVNWLIKPFSMAALGWLFFNVFFSGLVSKEDSAQYIAGMILLGVAPCTAMVFVWSQLTKGDPNYTLVQVSINDLILVVAFAPLAGFLLGMSNISVPWSTLVGSVVLYVVLPLLAGFLTRKALGNSAKRINSLAQTLKPYSVVGLLGTVLLLFGLQANTIIEQPFVIMLIAVPLLIQTVGVFFIAYVWARLIRLPYRIAAPACLIGTSNFFELAVAVAIGLFGLNSGAALATVVGVLVEVPIMLALVAFANKTQHWFQDN